MFFVGATREKGMTAEIIYMVILNFDVLNY